MTQRDMAGILKITPMTLRNWRKDKPELYAIIIKGFACEKLLEQSQKNLDELRSLALSFEIKKSKKD